MMTADTTYNLPPRTEMQYMVRKPKIEISNPPLLLLMHGVGSNEQDMFSLADYLPDDFLIIALRGPLTLGPNS